MGMSDGGAGDHAGGIITDHGQSMRNECQDMLIEARRDMAAGDYDRSLDRCHALLDGRAQCVLCPFGEQCWTSGLALIGEITRVRSRTRGDALQQPME